MSLPEPNSNPGQTDCSVSRVPADSCGGYRSNPLSLPQDVMAGWEHGHLYAGSRFEVQVRRLTRSLASAPTFHFRSLTSRRVEWALN